eukprot:63342_1
MSTMATLIVAVLVMITPISYTQHTYLYHDRLHTLSNFESRSVSSKSTPNCPSTASETLKYIQGNKICIQGSMNQRMDGQYEWQYYTSQIPQSIYHYMNHNISLYAQHSD